MGGGGPGGARPRPTLLLRGCGAAAAAEPALADAALAEREAAAVAAEALDGLAGEAAEAGAETADGVPAAGELGEAAAVPPAAFELRLPEGLRRGDRLLLTLLPAAAKQHAKQLQKLERAGVEVEVYSPPEASAAPRIRAAEGEGPLQLWERYCRYQRLPAGAAAAGGGLLRALLGGARGGGGAPLEQRHTAIEFESVEVEGYFRRVGPGVRWARAAGAHARTALPPRVSARLPSLTQLPRASAIRPGRPRPGGGHRACAGHRGSRCGPRLGLRAGGGLR